MTVQIFTKHVFYRYHFGARGYHRQKFYTKELLATSAVISFIHIFILVGGAAELDCRFIYDRW